MNMSLIFSVAAPLVTGIASLLWAEYVGRGMNEDAEINSTSDLRTW